MGGGDHGVAAALWLVSMSDTNDTQERMKKLCILCGEKAWLVSKPDPRFPGSETCFCVHCGSARLSAGLMDKENYEEISQEANGA